MERPAIIARRFCADQNSSVLDNEICRESPIDTKNRLAAEVNADNIAVNVVAPGPTGTALFLDGKPQSVIDQLTQLSPLERLGRPEDIANAVSFLAGPDGAWVNGQVLRVNGGVI